MSFKMFLSSLRQNLVITRNFRCSRLRMLDAKKNELTDEPIKYTTSDAAKWKAIYSTSGEDYFNTPRSQSFVVVMSLTAFMVYFCILREENDLDQWLRDLDKTVPYQVEEMRLRAEILDGKKKGIDVSFLEARFDQLQEEKKLIKIKSAI